MSDSIDPGTQEASPSATLFIVSIVQFLIPFTASSVGVALPVIGREFQASAVQLGLVQMAFVLAVAILQLPAGRFADIHGRKRIFIIGITLITAATIALVLAQNIQMFIVFRFLQGVGGAMIFSTSVAILSSVFPPEHRGRAMGVIVAAIYVGMAIGPTVAGFIITEFGWRWVFYIVIPFQFSAFGLTLFKLRGEWTADQGKGFDWIGSLIFSVALFLMIVGATQFTKMPIAKWIGLMGLLCLGLFLRIEVRTSNPLLDLHLVRTNLPFTFSNLATLINYAAAFGLVFLFSLYLQYVKGFSPKHAGLLLAIQPAIQALLAPIAGRLADRYLPERIATIGMGLCAAGLFLAAGINADSSLTLIISVMILLGLGFGFFSTPNMTAIMGSVEPRHYGIAASLSGTMRTIGMLISMTVITAILTRFLGDQAVTVENSKLFVASMHSSMLVFCVLSIVGILFSLGRGMQRIKTQSMS